MNPFNRKAITLNVPTLEFVSSETRFEWGAAPHEHLRFRIHGGAACAQKIFENHQAGKRIEHAGRELTVIHSAISGNIELGAYELSIHAIELSAALAAVANAPKQSTASPDVPVKQSKPIASLFKPAGRKIIK